MTLHHGDCLDIMAAMEPESVDAVVTDPPYGINFMGKAWDGAAIAEAARRDRERPSRIPNRNRPKGGSFPQGSAANMAGSYDFSLKGNRAFQDWSFAWAAAAFRVAKPSAYLLAFGGTRTVHRMTVAIEDAGWIIRDMLVWAYASGFPKSKASLKPAWEPIVMARKPGPLRELAIDLCRIGTSKDVPASPRRAAQGPAYGELGNDPGDGGGFDPNLGRWPANVILTADDEGGAIFDGGWDGVVGGGEVVGFAGATRRTAADGGVTGWNSEPIGVQVPGYGDSGTYSRFFLVPKADRADREPVLGGPTKVRSILGQGIGGADNLGVARANGHPTVKPTELMRHLVRLVTPTGGTVLDCFAGSGSTLLAAEMEGFAWIGVEKEAEYIAIAEARLNGTQRGLGLPA